MAEEQPKKSKFRKWADQYGSKMIPDIDPVGTYNKLDADYAASQAELDKWRAGSKSPEESLGITPPTDKVVATPSPMSPEELALFGGVVEPPKTDLNAVEQKIKDRSDAKKTEKRVAKAAALNDKTTLEAEMEALKERAGDLPARDYSMFSQKLEDLEGWFKQEKDRLDTSEALEKVAHAVAQFGGALYGMKHGVNTAGLTFDPTDWEKKQSRLLDEFRTGISSISERRKEQMSMDESAEDRAAREAEAADDRSFRWKMQESQQAFQARMAKDKAKLDKEIAGLKLAAAASKDDSKDSKTANTELTKAQAKISEATRAKDSATSESLMNEAYGHLLNAGMSSSAIEDALTEETSYIGQLFGSASREFKDPADANAGIIKARTTGGLVTVIKEGQEPRKVTPADAAQLEKLGWQQQ